MTNINDSGKIQSEHLNNCSNVTIATAFCRKPLLLLLYIYQKPLREIGTHHYIISVKYNRKSEIHEMNTQNQSETPSCELIHAHTEQIEKIRAKMPDDDTLIDLSELFKVFGDSTRIKILSALSGGELCVCDLSTAVGMSSSAVSHQLKILKNAQLVRFRRDGKTVFYSLADSHVMTILQQGFEHINE